MGCDGAVLIWAIVGHLIADWLLQNDWMARNKGKLYHPAAWVHSGIHTVFMALVFPWPYALTIGISHMLIDTRKPLAWWQRAFRQTRDGPFAVPIALMVDQVFHITVLALICLALMG